MTSSESILPKSQGEANAMFLREFADDLRYMEITPDQWHLVRRALLDAADRHEQEPDDPTAAKYQGTAHVEHIEWETRGVEKHIQHAVGLKVAIPVEQFAGLDISREFTITQETKHDR